MGIRAFVAASAALAMLLLALFQCIPAEPALAPSSDVAPPPTDEAGVIYTETQNLSVPNRIAVIEVANYGTIKFELYDNMTPITTQNFVDLAESGFYDGIKFHRCIDDFVAQTGDPNSKDNNPYNDGMGGSDKTIPLEINYNATHVDGAVGMARSSDPASASSQFYICDGPQHGLDDAQEEANNGQHGYAVFGVVVEGLDIAKSIAAVKTWGYKRPLLKDHPIQDVTMTKVTIEQGVWHNASLNMTPPEKEKKRSTPLGFEVAFFAIIAVVAVLYKRRY